MTRAIFYGLAALLASGALWLGSLLYGPSPAISLAAGYGGPFLAALITAYFAPHDRIFVGILIALPAALLARAVFAIFEAAGGHVDAVGLIGQLIVFMVSLSINTGICAIGGISGSLLASWRLKDGRTGSVRLGRKGHELRVD